MSDDEAAAAARASAAQLQLLQHRTCRLLVLRQGAAALGPSFRVPQVRCLLACLQETGQIYSTMLASCLGYGHAWQLGLLLAAATHMCCCVLLARRSNFWHCKWLGSPCGSQGVVAMPAATHSWVAVSRFWVSVIFFVWRCVCCVWQRALSRVIHMAAPWGSTRVT
jgi:hypothetical protein